ncbi:hypothetical protein FHW36_10963 [Chitinophaga polysaccharea]|uniref:Uncharacterized protein n=1 Tax=Chitinophaga polysaccharea TaxID=1293035 RepID=A0A561PB76_9BACT|nr:hypothetical protein [Chitinophaga polysaccharea]TWF35276.1 hypothetical protein FHW36_10963 [Chitinophaga polysaccharea]
MENESSSIFEHDFFAATAIRRRIISCLFIWMEKKAAILLALIVTAISLSAQCATIIYLRSLTPSFSGQATGAVAIMLELPFLVMLIKIKKDWETMAFSKSELDSKSL